MDSHWITYILLVDGSDVLADTFLKWSDSTTHISAVASAFQYIDHEASSAVDIMFDLMYSVVGTTKLSGVKFGMLTNPTETTFEKTQVLGGEPCGVCCLMWNGRA